MNKIHLICNAHIDPVWLWEWEEGAAAALATFRAATDLCEEFEGFVFNHNEALLYQWVEEFDPDLFQRIRILIEAGKWRIMGGWFLQPDCNMPSGESLIRQIERGRRYFRSRFDAAPTTAINFDPFGHSRGLVQILVKSGYDSYLFCRPSAKECDLPADDFLWTGFDGSAILAHRAPGHYNTNLGQARSKVEQWMANHPLQPLSLVLWGVGNHGGGPSRKDLRELEELMKQSGEWEIVHSTPENYFQDLKASRASLPRCEKSINPFSPGCYTTQIRVKQKHRLLENELYSAEKMLSHAAIQVLLDYPQKELEEAERDLLASEFHDILPGSSIQPVEEYALRLMDHGLEILSRLKTRAFFALAQYQEKAKEGEYPILIYNPHPYPVSYTIECEFQMADWNRSDSFQYPIIYSQGKRIPCQLEKEQCHIHVEWRKRAVFRAELSPSSMNRFNCLLEDRSSKPEIRLQEVDGKLTFHSDRLEAVINTRTGLMDSYRIDGVEYLKPYAFLPRVMEDDGDSWGIHVRSFPRKAGVFQLMAPEECARFLGIENDRLNPVRVIEDGEVRTVAEAVFAYGRSALVLTYKLPKQGVELEVEARVFWYEKNRLLKLSIPTAFETDSYFGQTVYGTLEFACDGDEAAAQKWTAAVSRRQGRALTCINDGVYGSDFREGEMRLSLLRSPGYASANFFNEEPILPQNRFAPRTDQGERWFRFWITGGELKERMDNIDREALVHNEKPSILPCFPIGEGERRQPFILIEGGAALAAAFKKSKNSEDYILRCFNPTAKERKVTLHFPKMGIAEFVHFQSFEIKTFKLNPVAETLREMDRLIEV
ncbi:MAG: glycoside hydrolase family 38 C-terminal domain-containing protein [Candidatus Omnitrophota bacterium]